MLKPLFKLRNIAQDGIRVMPHNPQDYEFLSFCACLCAQWLESIEVMKSALQQKMLDLESEKVNF